MLITRTKVSLAVKAMVANTETKTVETKEFTIPKVEEKKIAKELAKVLPENLKFVAVESANEKEILYGLDETVFMAHAVELDPKTRKPIEKKAEEATKTEAPKENK